MLRHSLQKHLLYILIGELPYNSALCVLGGYQGWVGGGDEEVFQV